MLLYAWTNSMGQSWKNLFERAGTSQKIEDLIKFVNEERRKAGMTTNPAQQVYPPANEVFSWTRYCSLEDVKVVIVGQDPYPQPGKAHGLAFSVSRSQQADKRDSIKNIFEAVGNNYPHFKIPGHYNLTRWAEQGVLLLNSVLTVRHQDPESHYGQGWEEITDFVIDSISDQGQKQSIVFMLWGECAKKKLSKISNVVCTLPPKDNPVDTERWTPEVEMKNAWERVSVNGITINGHLVITSSHPSPQGARYSFFDLLQFSLANKWLCMNGRDPIDWTAL